MKLILDQFIHKTNKIDKLLIILIFFFPILLSISIFLADLSASLASIIILAITIQKKNYEIFNEIKNKIYFFLIFYFLILISLFFSISFKESFLPSFFYFRYFLFVLSIYYLLKKYIIFEKILLYSIIFTFIIVILDSTFQSIFSKNFFNYSLKSDGQMNILTSFFNEEKKLGSYLIRLLPLLISLLYYFNFKKINYLFLVLVGIIIFFTSERAALFLFIVFSFFYFLIIKRKLYFVLSGFLVLITLLTFSKEFKFKYLDYTLMQLGIIETSWNKDYNNLIRYYSKEHEDLSYTAFKIFQNNILTGSGVKTFYIACNDLIKDNEKKIDLEEKMNFLNRNNNLKCSTHPHNTYFQILSDTGIFAFIFIFTFFIFVLKRNIHILLKKKSNNFELCLYFLNVGILLNLFPLIPSGNFYNNWLSLILFYPLGLWLYINQKIKIND